MIWEKWQINPTNIEHLPDFSKLGAAIQQQITTLNEVGKEWKKAGKVQIVFYSWSR